MLPSDIIQQEITRVSQLMRDPDAVFVFGSNLLGVHGAGAAREAARRYGAQKGVGMGLRGRSYAIPTKAHWRGWGMALPEIHRHIRVFLAFAREHPGRLFVVTRVGCGYAGHKDEDMAPLFALASPNCSLPIGWRRRNGEEEVPWESYK